MKVRLIDLIKTALKRYGNIAPSKTPRKIEGEFSDILNENLDEDEGNLTINKAAMMKSF